MLVLTINVTVTTVLHSPSISLSHSYLETMLKTLSVRKFNSKLPVFVVLNGTESKLNIEKIGVKQSFSVSELKQVIKKHILFY